MTHLAVIYTTSMQRVNNTLHSVLLIAASRLLGAMRTEVNPCVNFYEFACGKWVEKHSVPEDKGSIDTMEEVSDRLEKDLQGLHIDIDIFPVRFLNPG